MPQAANIPPDMDRLRWQCRRGMLELDEILLGYLEDRFPQATDIEQTRFRRLLDIEDPVLNAWLLLGGVPDDPELASAVACVRAG